jgi:hypothetical protein
MNEFSSPNTFPAPLQFIAQCHSRIECGTSIVALEDGHECRRWGESQRNKSAFPLKSGPAAAFMCTAACNFAHAALQTTRANILVHWKKSPAALFRTSASFPLAKSVVFASCGAEGNAGPKGS